MLCRTVRTVESVPAQSASGKFSCKFVRVGRSGWGPVPGAGTDELDGRARSVALWDELELELVRRYTVNLLYDS